MGGLGIGDITQGYSKTGLEEYKNDLNQKAISETVELMRQTSEIKSVFQAGWQGQSEVVFERNLNTSVEATAEALENLRTSMEAEFSNIASSIDDFDNTLLTEE